MNIMQSLRDFFINVFSGKATGLASHPTDAKPEGNKADTSGLETRCMNPDHGCRFEVT
jgi:hypothetical protein